MKICDRCKKELDTNKESILNGINFELCSSCADYISSHIKTYSTAKKKGFLGGLFDYGYTWINKH